MCLYFVAHDDIDSEDVLIDLPILRHLGIDLRPLSEWNMDNLTSPAAPPSLTTRRQMHVEHWND